jgi:hypothetical protein
MSNARGEIGSNAGATATLLGETFVVIWDMAHHSVFVDWNGRHAIDGSSYPESEWFHGRLLRHSKFPVCVRLRLYYEHRLVSLTRSLSIQSSLERPTTLP